MKKKLVILLCIITLCQSTFGMVYDSLVVDTSSSFLEEQFHNHIHEEEHDHYKRTDKLFVYASAVCTTHTYGAYTTTKAATCTTSGTQTRTCTKCAATDTATIPAKGHRFAGSVYTVVATCTTEGYSYMNCTQCSGINKFNISSPLGHNYTQITKQATCGTAGTKKCSRCTSTTSIPATGEHSYTVTTVAATCTSTGIKKCANCTATQSVSATGHMFGGQPYTVPPTCTEAGYSYVLCTRCNTEKNKFNTTSALGHNYSQITKDPTCVATGTKKCSRCTSTTSIPATGVHSYTVTTVATSCTSSGTKKCANCTATQSIAATGHMFGGQSYTVPPTCTEAGYSYVLCTRCNTEKNKFNTTSAIGHNYSQITKDPTCVATGIKKCSRCTSTTSIPATGVHSYTVTTVSATCTSTGTKKCANCTVTQSIPATGHMFGGQPYTVSPTCTEGGYSYVLCTRCNTEKNKFDITSAAGHNYSQITKEPTCVATGTKKCSRCTSTTSIPATGVHSYTVTTVAATCTSSGMKKCANCTSTQSVSATGHMFGGQPYTVPPKCEEEGYSYVYCTRCNTEKNKFNITSATGHNYNQIIKETTCIASGISKCFSCSSTTSTPATGHMFGGQPYTVPSTCKDEGYSYVLCVKCNTEKSKFNIVPATGHDYSKTTKEPTCIDTGIKKCSKCDNTTSIPATGEHSYTITTVATTCTSSGTKKCANCTATQSILATGHMFGGQPYTVPPTCTEDGYSYVYCTKCNIEKNKFNITPKTGHSYDQITKEPTCIASGIKKCSKCPNTMLIPATGEHKYTVTTVAVSCTSAGTKKCANCDATQSIPATGHKFGGEPYIVPPKCEEEGYSYVYCTQCKVEKNKFNIIPKTGHKYNEIIEEPSCVTAGTKKCSNCISTTTIPPAGHLYNTFYSSNDTDHWIECSKCDVLKSKAVHTFDSEQTCTICKYSITKVTKITLSGIPLELYTDKVYTVKASITPSNATNKTLTWTSSNPSVATVSSSGVVTPKSNGNVTITATSKDGIFGSITAHVRQIQVLSLQVGDGVIFKDVVMPEWSVNFVEGSNSIIRINKDNSLVALDAGEAVIYVEGKINNIQYYRVKVTKQAKLTKQQVINLAGPAPLRLYEHTPNERTFTFMDIISDISIGNSLANYYYYNVVPYLKGMPLDTDHSLTTINNIDAGFGEWLWMMYGYMAPTEKELMHMLLHTAGIIPIVGTVAEGYNAYLYYIEGDVVNALITAGVVVVSAIGDYYLIKDIVSEAKFAFAGDARSKLEAMPDSAISTATKSKITGYLDEIEGVVESWYKADGSINYPPNNGRILGTEVTVELQQGQIYGRFGEIRPTSNFITEAGASPGKLSLPPNTDPSIYCEIKVLKPIPDVTQSTVAPWAGSPGMGLQYELPMPLEILKELGYISY